MQLAEKLYNSFLRLTSTVFQILKFQFCDSGEGFGHSKKERACPDGQ